MKKLLLILLIVISTTAIGQPTFARGYKIHIGYDNASGTTIWQEGHYCNSLIKFDNSKVTIYGETIFEYHTIRQIYNTELQAKWIATDSDGDLVYVYIGYSDAEGSSYLILESRGTSVCIYTREE